MMRKTCWYCNEAFESNDKHEKFCSIEHSEMYTEAMTLEQYEEE